MFKRWFKSAKDDGPDPLSPIPEESIETFPSVLEEPAMTSDVPVDAPDPSPESTPIPFSSIPRRCDSVYLKPMVATKCETL